MKKIFLLVAVIATLGTAAQAQTDFVKNLRTNTTYSTFDAAKQVLQSGDTLQLMADYSLTSTFVVDSTTPAFTFDMNGHILDGSNLVEPADTNEMASVFYIGGNLTIIDSDPTSTHHTGTAVLDLQTGAIITGGQGTQHDGVVEGGAILSIDHSSLTVKGVTFCENSVENSTYEGYGGAVTAYGTLHMISSTLLENYSNSWAGAIGISTDDNEATLDSCLLYHNVSYDGGAIAVNYGTLTIAHTTIRNNTATLQGGAITNYDNLVLNDGTVITENVTAAEPNNGWLSGGIYFWPDTTTQTIVMNGNVTIKDNVTVQGSHTYNSNLCLSHDTVAALIVIDNLGSESEIGVSTMVRDTVAACPFTHDGNASQVSNFFSDVEGYEVAYNEAGYLETRATSSAIEQTETPIDCYAFTEGRNVVVAHAAGHSLALYDVMGHLLSHVDSANESERFTVPTHGIYIVSIDGRSSLRVVVR